MDVLKINRAAGESAPKTVSAQNLFQSAEGLDSMELDLIQSVENFIKNRKLEQVKSQSNLSQIKHLQERLSHQEIVVRQSESKSKEYEQVISKLEEKLSGKQMEFDQLLEDFTDHRKNAKDELDKLKNALSEEKDRCHQLTNKQNAEKESLEEVENKFKGIIQSLEMEVKDLKNRYLTIQQEKQHLIDTFNEFTTKLTTPLESGSKSK